VITSVDGNMCLLHGKILQECMQIVSVSICKSKNGDISDGGNYTPVSLATIISKLFEDYICPISHRFWPQQTSLASSPNMALTYRYIFFT